MLKHGLHAVKSFVSQRMSARLAVAAAIGCLLCASASFAEEEGEWTVTLIKHNNKAADAYTRGDWATAKNEYRWCIGASDRNVEFYEGLLNTCVHSKEWDQVAYAAQKVAEIDPARKGDVAYYSGMAMYQLNRFDEAVPWLRQALNVPDKNIVAFQPKVRDEALAALSHPSAPAPPPINKEPPAPVVKKVEKLDTQNYLSIEAASTRSESVSIATYDGWRREPDVHFNDAPVALFHITRILKGPPLNKDIPIRYEFHDLINKSMPPGWKFDEATKMPKKGSSWILFIETGMAKNGAYETYQGSYGRLEATDENLNKLYAVLDQYNMRNPNTR